MFFIRVYQESLGVLVSMLVADFQPVTVTLDDNSVLALLQLGTASRWGCM
jgi:hypothetical protein